MMGDDDAPAKARVLVRGLADAVAAHGVLKGRPHHLAQPGLELLVPPQHPCGGGASAFSAML